MRRKKTLEPRLYRVWAGITAGILVAVLMGVAPNAEATNGYFAHGYGTSNKGMAGAGVAFPQDALTVATNPAGLAFLDKRYDVGLAIFNPNREYTVTGNPSRFPGTFGLTPGNVDSDSEYFAIPHLGANWKLSDETRIGFAMYGNGGMNTDYPTSTFFGSSPTGVDLTQLFLATTWARRVGDKHGFGITPILAVQRFEAQGIQAFGAFSSDPSNLSNNDHDTSIGYGLKLGYLGQLTSSFSVGISYQTKMKMEEFDDYAGLFAEQGGFDIPSTATVGLAWHASSHLTFVLDVQETYYSDIKSVGEPLFPNLFLAPLGADAGAGFGWQDMTTVKAGVQWKGSGSWTWRFGYSKGDQPIPESEVLFNILAPGVMEEHITLGFSKELASGRAFHLALMHAPSSSVTGPNPLEVPGLQTITLEMDQWELEMSFSWGF